MKNKLFTGAFFLMALLCFTTMTSYSQSAPLFPYRLQVENTSDDMIGSGYFYNSSARDSINYGIYNRLNNTASGTKYGIQNYVTGNGQLYGIHTKVNGTGNYALWAEATSVQSKAALFDGLVDFKSDLRIFNDATATEFVIHAQWNTNSTSGNWVSITPVENGTEEFGRSTRFHENGTLIKYIDDSNKSAFEVSLNGTKNFQVLGSGKVFARDVEVSLDPFPDYVFDDDYDLVSLNELRNYIEANNHLPNMKSAAEVKENGMGLKELNIKQTEKIEELTLYILQLDERLKFLEEENQKLKKQKTKE